MLGPAGLKGPSVAAAIMRQRLMAIPRPARSISTFRIQRMRKPGQWAQLTPTSGLAPWKASSAAVGIAAIRFNSSWSDPAATPTAETSTTGSTPPAFDDLSTLDISTIPEQIGYLKQLGLDFGWGPASMMEWFIEHVHLWAGLPWWASIVTVGILTRAALLKPMLNASDNGAKLQNVKHLTAPLRAEMMETMQDQNTLKTQMKRAEINKIHADHGIKWYKTIIPMLQIPLAFGMFRVIRGMASLPVPGLANESVIWLTDLTAADPLYVLPALTSIFLYFSLKRGGEAGMAELLSGSAGKAVMIGLPVVSFIFMSFIPSALQLYFVATGLFAVCQAYMMHSHSFRRWAGLTIPQRASAQDSQDTLRYTRNMKARLQQAKKAETSKKAQDQKLSFIDRKVGAFREAFSNFVGKKTKAADGSPLPSPRITKEERQKAEAYEKQQRAYNYEDLENRNKARWSAYAESKDARKTEQWRAAQWSEMERARAKASSRK